MSPVRAVAPRSRSGPNSEMIRRATRGRCCPTHSPWDQPVFVSEGFSRRVCECEFECECVCVTLCISDGVFVPASWCMQLSIFVHIFVFQFSPQKRVFVTPGPPGKDREDHGLTLCSPHLLKSSRHHHPHHETHWPHLGISTHPLGQ